MKDIDWETIRENYPITRETVYFNNASMGPLPTNIKNTWEMFLADWNREDITHRFGVDTWEPLRAKVARFVGAEPEEICFCQSTSEGIIRASQSISFESGNNIVIPCNEFPSNVIPWKQLESEGVEIRFAEGDHFYVTERDIMNYCDENTKVVAVSAVSFSTGYRLDLKQLADYCHANNIYFFSDIIQGTGAMALDLNESAVDMAAFQAAKWIPSSSGTGVYFCSKRIIEELKLTHVGWLSVERDGLNDLLNFDLPPYKSARRFEGGTTNLLGMMGLEAAMDYYLDIGMENIETRILYLVDSIIRGLNALEYNIESCTDLEKRSGIIVFSVPDAEQLVDELRKKNIIVAVRNGKIRVSPHFYNNEEDIHRLLETLKR